MRARDRDTVGVPIRSTWEGMTRADEATWTVLHEGGARLLVHNPTVPRSPGGTGERLNLAWWVAGALEKPDGTPPALWGLGDRAGGHPVPSEEVLRIFTDAAYRDLAQPAECAVLRGRLALACRGSSRVTSI
jgi:hypothetical protein